MWQPKRVVNISPALERLQPSRREERQARYEQVIALRKLGLSLAAIARQVGMGASTVQSWLVASQFPERKPREQASHVDRYLPYLVRRWEEGCHNIAGLFQELVAQGYQGCYESIRNALIRRLPNGRKNALHTSSKAPALATARQAAFLFLRRSEKVRVEEQEMLDKLRQLHSEVDLAYDLVQQFTQMMRKRTGACLDGWLSFCCDGLPDQLFLQERIARLHKALFGEVVEKFT